MYSRRITAQSLAMSGHSLFDAGGPYRVEEDAVQRGLHELEALDARPRRDEPPEERLRIGAGCELHFEGPVGIVGPRSENPQPGKSTARTRLWRASAPTTKRQYSRDAASP